jgi:hypothetical protein
MKWIKNKIIPLLNIRSIPFIVFLVFIFPVTAFSAVSINPGSKIVAATSTSTTFTLTADEPWTITKNPADTWVKTIYPDSGNETSVITITYARNALSSDARSSVLSITGGNNFILTQQGDNEGPQAIAGDDFATNSTADLDGSASTDNIGIESYAWSKVSGPGSVVFGNSTSATTTAWASQEGVYTLQLTVTDSAGMTNSDQLIMTWDQSPPVINSVSFTPSSGWRKIGESITLNINATDDTDLAIKSVQINGRNTTSGSASAVVYTIQEGDNDIGENEQIPISVVLEDAAGNSNVAYTTSPSADQSPAIDANKPVITGVSFVPASGYHKIGDQITLRITATETDLLRNQIRINNVNVTNMTDQGGGIYTVVYSIIEGHTDIAENEQIPISVRLSDQAGNLSDTFTSSPLPNVTPAIDANKPVITVVSFSPSSGWHKIGDSFTMTISAGETDLTENSILVNGASVTNFTDNLNNTYSVTYTVLEGHTTVSESQQSPVSVRLTDVAGNTSANFTTSPAANVSPAIDGTKPVVNSVSFSPTTGLNKVGDSIEMTINAGEAGLTAQEIKINNKSISGITDNGAGVYTAVYTIVEGDDDIAEDESIPVRIIMSDIAGNTNSAFTTSPVAGLCPAIDANTPQISGVGFSPNSGILPIGDSISMTFQTGETGLSAVSIAVNGINVSSTFSDNQNGSYTVVYTIANGHTDRSPSQQIPVSIIVRDDAGNQNVAYTTSPSSTVSPAIDANKPVITAVSFSPSSGWRKIGDTITMTVNAGEAGLNQGNITVNNKPVTNFTDLGDGSYTVIYSVTSGDNDIADNNRIPVSVVLMDDAGNQSSDYTVSPIANDCPAIDANVPVINSVIFAPSSGWRKIGDAVSVTLNAVETGLTLISGVVNGKNVTGFSDNLDGTYSVTYSVVEGDNDIDAGSQIPVSFVLSDEAGNRNTAFTTSPSAANSPAIDGNKPQVLSLTYNPNSGWHRVGESFTLTVSAGESGLTAPTFDLNNKNVKNTFTDNGNGTYTVTYTVTSGDNDILETEQIPVNIILRDAAGNVSDAYTTPSASNVTPAIDATAPVISSVSFSPSSGWRKIGDTITMTIISNETGLNSGTITINGKNTTDFTDLGNGSYSAVYTVTSGDNDVADNERIPVSVTLVDQAGNVSSAYTTSPLSGACPAIDANKPVISQAVFEPTSGYHKIGDFITLNFNTGETGLTAGTIRINNKTATAFTDLGTGWYSVIYTVSEGDSDIGESEQIPISISVLDGAGNVSSDFTASPVSSVSPAIDANKPVITGVSFNPSSGWRKIGESLTMTITAGETGLQPSAITINSVSASGFTDMGNGSYTVVYTVVSGNNDVASDQNIPVSIQLSDPAGNLSSTYTVSPPASQSPGIDANNPSIISASYSPDSGWRKVGDNVTITLQTGESGLLVNTFLVNAKSVTNFSDNGDGSYNAVYMVAEGDNDIASNEQMPIQVVLEDIAGNVSSTFSTAPVANLTPEIDANSPNIVNVSFNPASGYRAIGTTVIMTISAGESGLQNHAVTVNGKNVSGFTDNGNGSYSVTYTVVEGDDDILDDEQIPVNVQLRDNAGNISPAYTTSPNANLSPSIDAARPVISSVSFVPQSGWHKIGDSFTMIIWSVETGLSMDDIKVNNKNISSFTDNGDNSYSVTYTVNSQDNDIAENQQIPVRVVLSDPAGNLSEIFTVSPPASQCPAIDANRPTISVVSYSPSSGWRKIGETIFLTIIAGETGLFENAITVNGKAVTDFTDNLDNTYTVTYTVAEGDNDISDGDRLPLSISLVDAVGNISSTFTTAPDAANCPAIDANRPVITNVQFNPSTGILPIGGSLEMIIAAGETVLTQTAISVNGKPVSSFTNNLNGTYSVIYTVSEGDTDRQNTEQIPVSIVLSDPAGNTNTAYSTSPAANISPAIDANRPIITSVSYSPSSGWRKIGDNVTVTIVAEESNLLVSTLMINTKSAAETFTDNTDNTYSAVYTVAPGDPDRGENQQIPVSVILMDSAGNSSALFNTAPPATSSPGIDANAPTAPLVPVCDAGEYINLAESDDFTITVDFSGSTAVSGDVLTLYLNGLFLLNHTLNVTDMAAGYFEFALNGSMIEPDGSKQFTARLTDIAGNAGTLSPSLNCILDRVLPKAVITYSDTIVKAGDPETITVTFSEPVSDSPRISIDYAGNNDDISNAVLTRIGLSDSLFRYQTIIPSGSVNDGLVSVSLSGTDLAGNPIEIESGSNSLLVDNIPPDSFIITDVHTRNDDGAITSIKPNYHYYNNSAGIIQITVPVAEDESLVDGRVSLEMKLGANPWRPVGNIRTITSISDQVIPINDARLLQDLIDFNTADGKILTVRATLEDIAGNRTVSPVAVDTVYIDRIAPVPGLVMDSLNTDIDFTRHPFVHPSWKNFLDLHSGIQKYEARIENPDQPSFPTVWFTTNLDTFFMEDPFYLMYEHGETYNFSVRAVDSAGNVSNISTSDGVMFDYITPLSVPVLSDYVYDTYYMNHDTLRGSCSDNGSGVKRVKLAIIRQSDGKYWNGSGWQIGETTVLSRFSSETSWYYSTFPIQFLTNKDVYDVHSLALDSAHNVQDEYSSVNFQYLVRDNPAFVTVQGDTTIREDDLLTVDLSAFDDNLKTRAPEILTFSVVNGPDGLSISKNSDTTAVINWQTDNDDVGTHSVTVRVSDHTTLTDVMTFNITVLPMNDPPYVLLPLPNRTISEDSKGVVLYERMEDYFNDIDATDSLRFSVFYTEENAVDTIIFEKNPNGDKTNQRREINRVDSGKTNNFEKDSKIHTNYIYSYATEDTQTQGLLPADHNTRMIIYLTDDYNGSLDIEVTAADDSSATVSDTFTLTVLPVNDKPEIKPIADKTIYEDSTLAVNIYISDVDVDPLTVNVISDTSAIPAFTFGNDLDTGYHEIIIPVEAHWFGRSFIDVIVSDGEYSDTSSFTVNILPVNDAPEPFRLLFPSDNQRITRIWPDTVRFRWATSNDVDDTDLLYKFSCWYDAFDTTFTTSDTLWDLALTAMDMPHYLTTDITWSVTTSDQEFTTAAVDSFRFSLDPPMMSINPDTVDMIYILNQEYDTSAVMINSGYKPLNWTLVHKPVWLESDETEGVLPRNSRDTLNLSVITEKMTYGFQSDSLLIQTNMPEDGDVIVRFLVEMVTTGKYSIQIVQNAAFHQYFDFMLNDSLGMADSIVFTVDDAAKPLQSLTPYTYTARLKDLSSGTHTLKVQSFSYAGEAEIERQIAVVMTKTDSDWTGRSPDGILGVFGKKSSLMMDSPLLLLDSTLCRQNSSDPVIYRLGVPGWRFDKPVLLSLNNCSEDEAVYYRSGNTWIEIPTIFKQGTLEAWVWDMGDFSIGEKTIIVPETTELNGNYPNPFNPSTTIAFDVGFMDGPNQHIVCKIYNIMGQEVTTLMNDKLDIGRYEWVWSGNDNAGKPVASGVYITRLMSSSGYVKTHKMTLIR